MLKFLIFSYLVSIGVVPVDLHLIATTIFLLVVIAISGVDTRPVLRCYWPTIALTMIASFVTIYYSVFDYNTMKGFGYCLLPVVYAMAGFIISNADDDQESLANIFIISSAAVSLYYIYQYYSLGNVDAESRFYIRSTIGKGFAICPVGLALAIYLASTNIDAYKKALYAVVMPIIAYGIYISESRTGIIGIIIILVSIFKIIQQKMLTMLSIPAIVLLFIFTTPAISVIFSDPTYALRHLPLGLQEVISIDYLTERDVTGHWRGFETFRAYQFMEKSGIIAWVIGTGLHRTCANKYPQNLENSAWRARARFNPDFPQWFFIHRCSRWGDRSSFICGSDCQALQNERPNFAKTGLEAFAFRLACARDGRLDDCVHTDDGWVVQSGRGRCHCRHNIWHRNSFCLASRALKWPAFSG